MNLKVIIVTVVIVAAMVVQVFAAPQLIGPRSLAMGGAGIAAVKDDSAVFSNPAALGFYGDKKDDGELKKVDTAGLGNKDFGLGLDATVTLKSYNEFGKHLELLADLNIDDLSANGIQSESDMRRLMELATGLAGIDDPGNGLGIKANAGLGSRFGHFAFGVRGYADLTAAVVDLDTVNLGMGTDFAGLNNDILANNPAGNDNVFGFFSASQRAELEAIGYNPTALQYLDYAARLEGLKSSDSSKTTEMLKDIANAAKFGTGALEDNTTAVLLSGTAITEVPFAYGYAVNDWLSVGVAPKVMAGRVYTTELTVFDSESDDFVDQIEEGFEETITFSADASVMARYKGLNFALLGRNLTKPEFDSPVAGHTFELDPQFTAGIAWIPVETFTLVADVDLNEIDEKLDGVEAQRLGIGVEWDVLKFLALRAGGYTDLAADEQGWVVTAGTGINVGLFRLDIGGGVALDEVVIDGEELPQEMSVSAALRFDF